jgi:hypothetical protein
MYMFQNRILVCIQRFNLSEVQDDNLFLFRVPADLVQFEFEYDHSGFIECDCKLAREKLSPTYQQNFKKNFQAIKLMTHVTDYLKSIQKHYHLFSGTLIGWYRDCGVIPYTTDMDMLLFHHEFDARIKKHFIGNKDARLSIVHGMRNQTYELRIQDDHHMLDLFVADQINKTHQVTGYFIGRDKYMYITSEPYLFLLRKA